MIVTIARQVIKPECFDAYHALAKELAEASRTEAGCAGYRLVQAEEDNRVHLFIECWKDLDIHCATEHFTRIVPRFAEMFADAEVVTHYQVNA